MSPLKPQGALHTQGPPWVDNASSRQSYDRDWIIAVCVMLAFGMVVIGYWTLVMVGITTLATLVSYRVMAKLLSMLMKQSPHISLGYALWNGMLLGLAFPVLKDLSVPLIAGLLLGILLHLVGRSFRLRIHPVALTLVLIWLVPAAVYRTDPLSMRHAFAQPVSAVLTPNQLLIGNVKNYGEVDEVNRSPWLQTIDGHDDAVLRVNPQIEIMQNQREVLKQPRLFVNMLTSGELPQLSEVIFGVVPGPVGATSPALLLMLMLMLIYKRHASWRTAISALVMMICVYLILPLKVGAAGGGEQITFVMTQLSQMSTAAAITFLAYVVLASPWCLVVLIFAPAVDPMSRPGRIVFGLMLGCLIALSVWLCATPEAVYLAVVVAGIFSKWLDFLHKSPFVQTAK